MPALSRVLIERVAALRPRSEHQRPIVTVEDRLQPRRTQRAQSIEEFIRPRLNGFYADADIEVALWSLASTPSGIQRSLDNRRTENLGPMKKLMFSLIIGVLFKSAKEFPYLTFFIWPEFFVPLLYVFYCNTGTLLSTRYSSFKQEKCSKVVMTNSPLGIFCVWNCYA